LETIPLKTASGRNLTSKVSSPVVNKPISTLAFAVALLNTTMRKNKNDLDIKSIS